MRGHATSLTYTGIDVDAINWTVFRDSSPCGLCSNTWNITVTFHTPQRLVNGIDNLWTRFEIAKNCRVACGRVWSLEMIPIMTHSCYQRSLRCCATLLYIYIYIFKGREENSWIDGTSCKMREHSSVFDSRSSLSEDTVYVYIYFFSGGCIFFIPLSEYSKWRIQYFVSSYLFNKCQSDRERINTTLFLSAQMHGKTWKMWRKFCRMPFVDFWQSRGVFFPHLVASPTRIILFSTSTLVDPFFFWQI